MTRKGVDCYLRNASFYDLQAQVENTDGSRALSPVSVERTPLVNTGNVQINWRVLHAPYVSFAFSTTTEPPQFFREDINVITGNTSGPLDTLLGTRPILGDEFALSYGMFDAGTGKGTRLTDQDQIYAYLTGPQRGWTGALVAANPAIGQAPFASFVLPGAHDAGMFDPTQVDRLCLPADGIAALAAAQLRGVLIGEAFTQKDPIPAMLDLGCLVCLPSSRPTCAASARRKGSKRLRLVASTRAARHASIPMRFASSSLRALSLPISRGNSAYRGAPSISSYQSRMMHERCSKSPNYGILWWKAAGPLSGGHLR